MKVKFKRAYNFVPGAAPMTAVSYPEGFEGRVTRECAEKAIAAGAATKLGDDGYADDGEAERAALRGVETQDEGAASGGEDGAFEGGGEER